MDNILYECGICECLHRWDWNGDCREDSERYSDELDYAEKNNVSVYKIEVRSWDERVAQDYSDANLEEI